MKLSYTWLRQYVPTALTPIQLAEQLRLSSCEVEDIITWGENLKDLVVGEVLTVTEHPNSTKLHLATVSLGKKKINLVCGAPNLAVGQKVVVALPGVTIHPLKGESVTLEVATIRGEKSEGMLCAYDEIGINLTGEGIIVLDPATTPGTAAADALGLSDTVLDLEITPNRPDLLSYMGIAREVATFDHKRLEEPTLATLDLPREKRSNPTSLHLGPVDTHLSPRISAVVVENITIKPSPQWLQSRLLMAGIKPINNVVDVTNYVMLELGQPLHAYDAREVATTKAGNYRLGVRSALKGEKLTILDHSTRALEPGDIVIVNEQDQPLGLAGIMGGLGSGVREDTTTIVIESAVFLGSQIRRTSRRLGLRSEASTRFEKGLDPEQTISALKRAVHLLQEIGSAEVASEVADHSSKNRHERPRLHINYAWVQQVLGVHISSAECKTILQKLGFHMSVLTKSSFEVTPPSWRADIQLPEDIVEELIRIWGYDRLPSTLPSGAISAPSNNATFAAKRTIRHALAAQGFRECISLSLTSATNLKRSGISPEATARVRLPLSSEGEYLIPSHIVTFLQNISGPNREEGELQLTEIGTTFNLDKTEQQVVSLCIRSNSQTPEMLYRQMKTAINRVFFELFGSQPSYTFNTTPASYLQAEGALVIENASGPCGTMGLVPTSTIEAWKIRTGRTIVYAELNLPAVMKEEGRARRYNAGSSYPAIKRDITLTLKEETPVSDLEAILEKEINTSLVSSHLIDTIYRGKNLPQGTKSVTVRLTYQAADRTLEDSEVNADIARLTERAISKLA